MILSCNYHNTRTIIPNNMSSPKKFLLSGGGTGGHIFPAVAIADALRKIYPDAEFLFVGALGRMEMEKVPSSGYEIKGIPIAGFQRGLNLANIIKNLKLPFLIIRSFYQVYQIIQRFKPDMVIGTGGYASGPTLRMAQWLSVPTVIQEQNALPGYTNRLLGVRAACAFISFEHTASFFPNTESLYTGNAIRESIQDEMKGRDESIRSFGFDPSIKTIFVTGGSLGARAINEGIAADYQRLIDLPLQIIWQCGKSHFEKYKEYEGERCRVVDFLSDIQLAYGAADIIVTRAGGALFEMFVIGKPIIALPSPYVAEDHQTKNAEALVEKNAAVLIHDRDSQAKLGQTIIDLIDDSARMNAMQDAVKALARPHAAATIAKKIQSIIENNDSRNI